MRVNNAKRKMLAGHGSWLLAMATRGIRLGMRNGQPQLWTTNEDTSEPT